MSAKLSDKELRQQALKLSDPYEQRDLAWEIPAGVTLLDILNLYTFDQWPKQKVYCVHCRGHHHKNGFTALLSNGQRVLLGSKCGGELFDESWTDAEKRMKERTDRQWELAQLDRLKAALPSFQRLLPSWRNAVDKIVARRETFKRHLGELASRISEAALVHGGKLTALKEVSERPTEASPKGIRSVRYTIAALPGGELFKTERPLAAIDDAIEAVEQVTRTIGQTDLLRTTTLRRSRRALEDTFDRLIDAAALCEAAEDFFTKECFALLVGWMNDHIGTRDPLLLLDDGIDYRDGRRGVRLPATPLPTLDTVLVQLIREFKSGE